MKSNTIKKIETLLIFLAIILLAFILGLEMLNFKKVIYGVNIGTEKIGGLNSRELKDFLILKSKNQKNIIIQSENNTWERSPKELGMQTNINTTINSAFSIGREKNIFSGIKTQIISLLKGYSFKIEADTNEEILNKFILKNISKLNSPAQNAKFSYNEDDISIIKEIPGKTINKEALKKDILANITSLSNKPIKVKFKTDTPNITKKDLVPLLAKLDNILKNSPYIILEDDSQSWKIDDLQIKELLEPIKDSKTELSLNQKKLQDFLIQISPSINREPINATLTIKNGKVAEFALSKNGTELEIEKSAKKIESEILKGKRKIQLITKEVPAEIRTDTIDNLGIVTKIGSGVSDFSGSPASRIHNIKLGAEKINGVLLKPGEEFSFVKNLGEISKAAGYKASYVIKNGKTFPEYGGGLCQVSTTTFRAAMYAGLKITERFPHSYPVAYYNPQGFDAAIYGPHPDLRFKNDTPANILIQAYTKGTKLYFDFYGTSDGREVKLIGPIVYDKKPDGSLKTKLTREIYDKNGELLKSRTFWSSYKSKDLYPIVKNPLE